MQTREAQYQELIASFGASVARLAFSYANHITEKDDLEQEIWLAVWRALPDFRGESSVRTFVMRIAHNRAISTIDQRKRVLQGEPDIDVADPNLDPEQQFEQQRKALQLQQAVRQLPLALRQVVTLRLEGLSLAEIAEVLGISENNATVRCNRAKKQLTQVMEKTRG